MILEGLLGTLTGGILAVLPPIVEFFNRREELRHEVKLTQIKAALSKEESQHEMAVIRTRADAQEGDSLRLHDASLTGTGFINALRSSVRPVITYAFFFLFVAVKIMAVYAFLQSGTSGDWLGLALAWENIYPIIWDANTAAMFGAVMGFWFGGRQIDKLWSGSRYG